MPFPPADTRALVRTTRSSVAAVAVPIAQPGPFAGGGPVGVARTAGGGREVAEQEPLRLAILDRDSGFVAVLLKRMQAVGWHSSLLPAGISTKALADVDADVLIVDLSAVAAKRWSWLGKLCRQRPDLRVVVCSPSTSVSQRVLSLRVGVEDWLTKPCHPEELIARVEAITRGARRRPERDLEPVRIGDVEVRPDQYQAFVAGRSIRLTQREYHMMELLARGGGEIQEREWIYETLWGRKMSRNDRSVDVCVHKLRRKLELASPGWRYIHTHYGIGYRLAAEPRVGAPVRELRALDELCATSLAA